MGVRASPGPPRGRRQAGCLSCRGVGVVSRWFAAGAVVACTAAAGTALGHTADEPARARVTVFETSVALHVEELPGHLCRARSSAEPDGVTYACPYGAREPIPASVLADIGLP